MHSFWPAQGLSLASSDPEGPPYRGDAHRNGSGDRWASAAAPRSLLGCTPARRRPCLCSRPLVIFWISSPNPYYKKGGGTLHLDGLRESIIFAKTVGAIPILLLILVGVLGSVTRRWIAYIGCTGVLLGMWLLLSSEMNYNYRFQFPIVIVVLLMVIDLGSRELPSLARRAATIPSPIRRFRPSSLRFWWCTTLRPNTG